jgi:transcriptional regulator with XRE-family HTH domain
MKGLRFYRNRSGMSIDALAAASGVSRATIWNSEVGKTSPSIESLERMADALGVSASQILAGGGCADRTAREGIADEVGNHDSRLWLLEFGSR